MPEFVDKNSLVLMMEKHADYDSQPRACYRMVKIAKDFPTENAVPITTYLSLIASMLDSGKMTPDEVATWRKRAGI